ncbi:MAG: PBECR4 domain-containing protein [Eubacteriales bacterium]|nr:PBECR4 domain-containing protein [Eubacteriales bacterium]
MDYLKTCAKAFERLLDVKYHIIIGRKGKLTELNILFDPTEFHHLVGSISYMICVRQEGKTPKPHLSCASHGAGMLPPPRKHPGHFHKKATSPLTDSYFPDYFFTTPAYTRPVDSG